MPQRGDRDREREALRDRDGQDRAGPGRHDGDHRARGDEDEGPGAQQLR